MVGMEICEWQFYTFMEVVIQALSMAKMVDTERMCVNFMSLV